MASVNFSRLAELAADRGWALACPTIGGRSYYDPASRETAERAACEFETAAILWRTVCPRSYAECMIQARNYREGATLTDRGLI